MADERGYELSTTNNNWDDDLYFIVDKLGYARTRKYLASVLKGHLKVGDQQYTEENYVNDDETLTVSVNSLDIALYALSNTVSNFTGLLTTTVTLGTGNVAALGSAYTLMAAPAAYRAYEIVDIKWSVNPSTQLDVGTQNLEVYFDTMSNYMGLIRNSSVEAASQLVKGVQVQPEHEVGISKALLCKLSGDANPDSGSATMRFYIVYRIITLPIPS